MMPGYEDPYNQRNRQEVPGAGQQRRVANNPQSSAQQPHDMRQNASAYGQQSGAYGAMQGSGTYPPVNQQSGTYGAMQGSGTYPPVNQQSGAYGAMQGSGTYPPVNQQSGTYGAMQGSGTYPPVNQQSGTYGAMQGSGTYPPVNQQSGTYGAMQGSGTYPPVNRQSGTYGAMQGSGAYPPVQQADGAYSPMHGSAAYPPVQQASSAYGTGAQQPQSPEGWPAMSPETQNHNPFDETGYDPSLRDMRATRLMSHKDPFWEDFRKQQKKQRKREKREARKASAERAGSHIGRKTFLSLAVVCLVVYWFFSSVYVVREIEVMGDLHTITKQQVATQSGLVYGQSMTDVDRDDVAAHITSNRYLIFLDMETQPLNKVILTVKEREHAAVLTFSGTRYLIDHRGMVLEESPSEEDMAGLPVISGIQIKGNYGCRVGSFLKTESSAQFDVLCNVLLELKVQSAENLVTTINFTNMNNILMETSAGYGVCLGDDTYIHGKIKAMLYVMGSLAEQRLGPGTIDVSNRQQPTYIPD